MNQEPNIPDVESGISGNAVSLYGQNDAMDDFPVLKAFQQYIDSEQAKARKRMLMLCAFFGFLMVAVIAVFVILLINVSTRNQALNDRLVEYAMQDRNRPNGSPVVVQPQDSAAILTLNAKLEEMQKQLSESQAQAARAAADAAAKAEQALKDSQPKGPSPEELEIKRLKALLAAEREKASAEKERQHQAEIEAYRRKYYPELYEDKKILEPAPAAVSDSDRPSRTANPKKATLKRRPVEEEILSEEDDEDLDALLKEVSAIRYFDDDESSSEKTSPKDTPSAPAAVKKPASEKQPAPAASAPAVPPVAQEYSIPVDVKSPSGGDWSIPHE